MNCPRCDLPVDDGLRARRQERERIIEAIRDRARALSAEAWASQQAQTLRDLSQQSAALEQMARILTEEGEKSLHPHTGVAS